MCEKGDVTVLWNQAVHTDREVTANRPDTIIKNTKEKTCTLIDVTIPADRNVVQKVLRPALVSGEHINVNRVIYSFINAGQNKIYVNFTIKY